MDDVVFKLADEDVHRDRLALLLELFSKLSDGREMDRSYPGQLRFTRYRAGNGAKNMAVVRRFSLILI